MLPAIKQRLKVIDAAGVGVLACVVLAAFFGGVLPLYRQASADTVQGANFRMQSGKIAGLTQTLAQVEADLKGTGARLAETETKLPSADKMDDFMRQLSKVADDAGLQVDSVNPQKVIDGGEYKIKPIQISGTGTFDDCYKFLIGLRHMDRLTRLDDLVLKTSDGSDPKVARGNCHMDLVISTFMAR